MKTAIGIILLLFMMLNGCNYDPVERARTEFNKNYLRTRSVFDSSLVSTFPVYVYDSPAIIKGYTFASYEYYKFNGMILEVPYSDSLAQALVRNKYKIAYSSQDSNLLIVGRLGESTVERYREFEKSYPWSNSEGYIPVPNFYEHNYSIETSLGDIDPLNNRLPEGYTIYVVDASPGIYIKKEWLTEGLGLPPEWKNGYSRGYAISSDTTKNIIYWLAIW
ncbi:hypothetical protein [uncultured Sanguibacteroides sp.]|uniref:hypothetical protein n=1 Tax=uncultured Sanguibacteroides sp. TaxID=1635151 RepID=UPI0025FD293D|nr:hypothetical protein [uncultured Sanguibacteroides sp.]